MLPSNDVFTTDEASLIVCIKSQFAVGSIETGLTGFVEWVNNGSVEPVLPSSSQSALILIDFCTLHFRSNVWRSNNQCKN